MCLDSMIFLKFIYVSNLCFSIKKGQKIHTFNINRGVSSQDDEGGFKLNYRFSPLWLFLLSSFFLVHNNFPPKAVIKKKFKKKDCGKLQFVFHTEEKGRKKCPPTHMNVFIEGGGCPEVRIKNFPISLFPTHTHSTLKNEENS